MTQAIFTSRHILPVANRPHLGGFRYCEHPFIALAKAIATSCDVLAMSDNRDLDDLARREEAFVALPQPVPAS